MQLVRDQVTLIEIKLNTYLRFFGMRSFIQGWRGYISKFGRVTNVQLLRPSAYK